MRKFVLDAIVTGLPAKTDYTLGEYKLQVPFKPLVFSSSIVSVRSLKIHWTPCPQNRLLTDLVATKPEADR